MPFWSLCSWSVTFFPGSGLSSPYNITIIIQAHDIIPESANIPSFLLNIQQFYVEDGYDSLNSFHTQWTTSIN